VDSLIRRNPLLLQTAIKLHQSGEIPQDTWILDLDAHVNNARATVEEAKKYNLHLNYMSKQMGRNPLISQAVVSKGMDGVVAVESQEAKSLYRYGLKISHVGHLVQIPVHEIDYALSMRPDAWTVLSYDNARVLSERAQRKGVKQDLLVQVIGKDDMFYQQEVGGFNYETVVEDVQKINSLPNVQVVGTTTMPALLYDLKSNSIKTTNNLKTVVAAANRLRDELGIEIKQINAPGHTQVSTMKLIADAGATHGEPGTGISGAGTWQVYKDQVEIPAMTYVTEVSHIYGDTVYLQGGGTAYALGGYGISPDGSFWMGPTDCELDFLIGRTYEFALANRLPSTYKGADPMNYTHYFPHQGKKISTGDTALSGFCSPQVWVTRSWVAVVQGIQENNSKLLGIFDQGNNLVDKHGHLLGEKPVLELMKKVSD
jgi:predicted amino acid racemase